MPYFSLMKNHHKISSSHNNEFYCWHQWQHINDNISNNLPLCHWWKHTNFIHNLPLWWCFSPLKLLSPFDINGKGFLPLWLIYVFLYVSYQNLNLGNSPYNHAMSSITEWLPLSIFSLFLWLFSPFVSKRVVLPDKVSPLVISTRCHVYYYIQHTNLHLGFFHL